MQNQAEKSSNIIPINGEQSDVSNLKGPIRSEDMELLESISDKISRFREESHQLYKDIAHITPFMYESDPDKFIAILKELKEKQRNWAVKESELRIQICETYPTFNLIQRTIVIVLSLLGRVMMDEFRMKQIWIYPKTRKQYLNNLNQLVSNSKENVSKLETLQTFAEKEVYKNLSDSRKAKVLEKRKKLEEDNRDLVNLFNRLTNSIHTDLHEIAFAAFLNHKHFETYNHINDNHRERFKQIWERLYGTQLADTLISRDVSVKYLKKFKDTIQNSIHQIDDELEQIDDNIDLEVKKMFV